ncbi:MAG: TIGR00282 family metallophosphoesterase [Desulfobacca sp.]|uniref:TIGR00282 family metallophosphoesterase n=1 Tax=Desulfobacca sp. TaxID=2067990 RepID=UPI00404A8108
MKIFFIGDIMGAPGRKAVAGLLHKVVDQYNIDLVVANGENASGGMGITPEVAEQLFQLGIDVITTGNHVWKHKEIQAYLQCTDRLLRPANYPAGTPGQGLTVIETAGGEPAAILNLEGRIFMSPLDCPFRTADRELAALSRDIKVILVDMHAEATSEKIALAWYLDGRVSAVIGTHTHVQTADERLFPQGLGYLTDAGMTGPMDGVIGMDRQVILERFLSQLPQKFKVASQNIQLQGVVLDIAQEGNCRALTRIQLHLNTVGEKGHGLREP